ncbi:TlpA family protein disulfide reductase [bacterium]|nr:MAG: TlpA family protein disulfide reductase [bacterium]
MKFSRSLRLLAALTAVLIFAATSALAVTAEEGAANLIKKDSDPVLFTLDSLKGNSVSLQDLLGKKAVMLVFWSIFCGPCQEELPLVDKIGKKYKEQGLDVYTINLDGPKRKKNVDALMNMKGFGFEVLWEKVEGAAYLTADAYGVGGTPSLIIIGKNGKVSFAHVGNTTEEALEKEVEAALK